jgi:hypothetical protein
VLGEGLFFWRSFREKKLHLKAQLPVGATLLRLQDVAVGCKLRIDRQLAQLEVIGITG